MAALGSASDQLTNLATTLQTCENVSDEGSC